MGLKELQNIRDNRDVPKEKKRYVIPKISKKRAAQIEKEKTAMANLSRTEKKQIKQSVRTSVRSLVSSEGNKEVMRANGEDKVAEAELELFFMLAATELAKHPYCQECGAFIPNKKRNSKNELVETNQFYRAATAHVLAKRKEYGFPSIASNPINRLFLGAGCGCHSKYDRSWEDAAQMKVFPLAIEKFKQLYHLIPAQEKKNIPDILMQEIDI